MARRKPWDDLSPGYRKRLERAGVTRETHGSADLGLARGHSRLTLPRGRYPAPAEATQRLLEGRATAEDRALLQRWYSKGHAPAWITDRAVEWDVAAAVSVQVFTPPDRGWEQVHFDPSRDLMEITFDDGSTLYVQLPPSSWPDLWEWSKTQEDANGDLLDVTVGTL